MTKRDSEGLQEVLILLDASSSMVKILFDRLYSRAGDAWQFKSAVDEIVQESKRVQEKYGPKEPTVGPDEEEEEVAGLA